MSILQEIRERYGERIHKVESALHQNPEMAMEEFETTALLKTELQNLGYEIINLGLKTGVVARLRTGKTGPVIGLRADIDALPQLEAVDRPDRSMKPGVMHACGHDVHAAGLLGAAMALAEDKDRLTGDVVVIMQPAEETIEGANYLIEKDLFSSTGIKALFGLHNNPDLMIGTVGVHHGTLMAAKDDFNIIIRGRGGHGGLPHQCADPIVAACGVVNTIQTIVSRNVDPAQTAVVSVCSIHGGSVSNLISNEVRMAGCVRTFSTDVQDLIIRRLKEIVENTAAAYGCTGEFDHYATMRPLINSEELYEIARDAVCNTVGETRLVDPIPSIASEDFAAYGVHVPTFFYFLGSGRPGEENAGWHSADFHAHPETSLYGAALLYNTVMCAQRRLS